jgi:glycosyltransferase involved in cell wall biosynthesis
VKIAIDIRRITEFGIGTYTRNVVRALTRLDHDSEYLLIGSPQRVEEMGPLPPNFHAVPLLDPDHSPRGYLRYRAVLKQSNCDLVHVPHLFAMPRRLPCPYVLTVHDVLEHMSRTNGRSDVWRMLNFQLTRRALKGAACIFAVSKFTKSEIEKLFGIAPERIRVVYNAIDARFLSGHATEADRQFLAERSQVNYPSLL